MIDKSREEEQKLDGLYHMVSIPLFYELFQNIVGASRARKVFFSEWAKTDRAQDILDVGCGPGVALQYLEYRRYLGIDVNPRHIERARRRRISNADFAVGAAQDVVPKLNGTYDIILALGFLHHLNDSSVHELLDCALGKLRPGGCAYFLEPVYLEEQRFLARKLKDFDSGQHIRTVDAYTNLLKRDGFSFSARTSHDLLRVPYNHFWGKLRRDVEG